MSSLKRRRLLCTLGTLAAGGSLAGCLEDSPVGGDEDGDDRLRGDAVVDYPGMVDGAASVSGDEQTIRYDEPEATFELVAGYRGEEAAPSDLRLGRDLSVETMAVFVAPAYVDADERFEYHVFANEAFVEFADWYVVGISEGSLEDLGGGSFEHLQGAVHGFVLAPDGYDGVGVVDETADDIEASSQDELTGVAITRTSRNVRSTAPNVAFAFYYDADAERLEITHEGGDSVPADEIRFDADGELTVREDFEGTVGAGDSATVSVPSTATVRVVWESGDRDESATLASWDGPDA